jgi:hypothetical protein
MIMIILLLERMKEWVRSPWRTPVYEGVTHLWELAYRGLSICISNHPVTTCLAWPLRTCLVIDVLPLRNFFEFLRRKVFCTMQLVVLPFREL